MPENKFRKPDWSGWLPSRLLHRSIKRSKYSFLRHHDGQIVCKHFSDAVMENVPVIVKTFCWCVTSYNFHTHNHILPKVNFGRHALCIMPIRLGWFWAGNVRRCCELDNEMLQAIISWFAWQCNTSQQLSWVLHSQCPVQTSWPNNNPSKTSLISFTRPRVIPKKLSSVEHKSRC